GKEASDKNAVGVAMISPDATSETGKFNALPALTELHAKAKGQLFGAVIFVGEIDEEKLKAAKDIQLKIGGKKDEELPPEEKTAPIVALKTESQGTDLLGNSAYGVEATLAQFIARRVSQLPKKRLVWEKLEEPKRR
ncbi:MAG: hypothetical protein HUK22_01680, partial [Thermoguttaceae bacterium]|nr:hypothetical protein [Thermoguttaceae bacterium]